MRKTEHLKPNDAAKTPPNGALINRLIKAAEAEETLLQLLSAAVERGDQEEVFRIAAGLTGRTAPASASAEAHSSSPRKKTAE